MKNLTHEVLTARLSTGGEMPSLELMQTARDQTEELQRVLKLARSVIYKPPVACQPFCPCIVCLIDRTLRIGDKN